MFFRQKVKKGLFGTTKSTGDLSLLQRGKDLDSFCDAKNLPKDGIGSLEVSGIPEHSGHTLMGLGGSFSAENSKASAKRRAEKPDALSTAFVGDESGVWQINPVEARRQLYHQFHNSCDNSFLSQLATKSFKELDQLFEVVGQGVHFRTWKIPLRFRSPLRVKGVEAQGQAGCFRAVTLDALVLKKPLEEFYRRKSPSLASWRSALGILHQASMQTLISPFCLVGSFGMKGANGDRVTDPRIARGRKPQDAAGNIGVGMLGTSQVWHEGGRIAKGSHQEFALVMPFGTLLPSHKTPPSRDILRNVSTDSLRRSHQASSLDQMVGETEAFLRRLGVRLHDIPQIRWWGDFPMIVDLSDASLD